MKEQLHAILDKAKDSLDAAKLLADQGYFDFAASRTYYAMFYTAEALLLSRGLSFSSHAAVYCELWERVFKNQRYGSKIP